MPITDTYILMLEDDQDDRYLTSSVIEELDMPVAVRFLSNTEDLFPTLEQKEPMLILMDYNLNPETGLELLKKLKGNLTYKHIPVVLLGDTDDPYFVTKCYEHGANTYATKPTNLEATKKKIGLFFNYWLQVAETKMHQTTNTISR
ncbi:MAG: hypothetical protein JWP88_2255 [Flaviaesturariibacter sp.]|nr:hypothetical protein [Flaviaesturariibacter sp.]